MIKFKTLVCSLLIFSQSIALPKSPPILDRLHERADAVHWAYRVKKLEQNKYEIYITAKMKEGWHIYAQAQPKESIAVPTRVKFSLNPMVEARGILKEFGKKEKQEIKEAGITQYEYADTVDFVQLVIVKANIKTNISGTISYQACSDEVCLPVKTISFNLSLN